jgi:hypothetical protein
MLASTISTKVRGRRFARRVRGLAGIATIAVLCFFAPPATGQKPVTVTGPVGIRVDARPLTLFESRDESRRRFGPLHFRGGLVLSSSHRDFGGISSIRLDASGEHFLAVTDKGNWLRGKIRYSGEAPAGIDEAEMAPMLGPDGRPITARRWYDAEALALEGGVAYVALERVHRILRFDYGKRGLLAHGQLLRVPPEFKQLPSNKGIEGLIVVPKGMPLAGTLLALSERGLDDAGNIRGFLLDGATPGIFGITRSDDFDITDAAITPRGDLLILERSFSFLRGAGMRIRSVPLAALRPGAVLDGTILFRADSGYQIDNMEGLSVHRGPAGEIVLTIVSDDNFSSLQRTLLLQFTLVEP